MTRKDILDELCDRYDCNSNNEVLHCCSCPLCSSNSMFWNQDPIEQT